MIIARAPFRISFVGGGTDIAEFYRNEPGAVVSTAINKYVYITVNPNPGIHPFKFRVAYSVTENVNEIEAIQHPIVKEALRLLDYNKPIEITNVADFPAKSGLGSSSTFAVCLLHALHALKGEHVTSEQLAREAHQIEVDILKRPIGKQDHYASAYGGLNHIQFMPDETVKINPIICSKKVRSELFDNLMMFFTGITRDAGSVLKEQVQNTPQRLEILRYMRDMTGKVINIMQDGNDLSEIGRILHDGWIAKKKLASTISNDIIDSYYEAARLAGALGGKILGAGGGGCLLLFVEKENQDNVRNALKSLTELEFNFEPEGSKVVYISD
ncbi:MAG: GHMP kinase [Candidatus Aenigmarchaeota archaeon]|nr:GHMP kinase [Candidatus Aenigmarchaeota archaeon]